jgi:biopolymer transport protein ExbD
MNFRRQSHDDPLEVNLIPLIDVLLVILIFLAASTSFTRYQQMQVALPQAAADAPVQTDAIDIAISREGIYALNGQLLKGSDAQSIAQALQAAAAGNRQAVIIINADAQARHEAVVRVMEAARLAGIERINFATQGPQ